MYGYAVITVLAVCAVMETVLSPRWKPSGLIKYSASTIVNAVILKQLKGKRNSLAHSSKGTSRKKKKGKKK